jgi:Fe-S oxidoreductase
MSATLEKGLNTFKKVIDAPVAAFFESCVHCGLCAEACLFYTETKDPKYTPIYKLKPLKKVWRQEYTFWGKIAKTLGLTKPPTDEELAEWCELIYGSCTMCGRCSLVCPVGNDIAYMVRKAREGMAAAGHAPEEMIQGAIRAVTIGSAMGVGLKALKAQIRHIKKDTGLTVPLDVEGTEYMMLLSAPEIVNFPEYIIALTRIFKQTGISWTLCSEAFEATNAGMSIGVSEITKLLLERIVAGAEKLKVRAVISPECGHAYGALRWEGPNLIGRPYSFEVIHILELLDQLQAEGRLRTTSKDERPMTFHDPCQLVRRGGVVAEPHRLLNSVATDFREMSDTGIMNWCCGGGGGVGAIESAESLRYQAFKRKKAQVEETGVETVVTACSNCQIQLENGFEYYDDETPVEVLSLTELIAEQLPTESGAEMT